MESKFELVFSHRFLKYAPFGALMMIRTIKSVMKVIARNFHGLASRSGSISNVYLSVAGAIVKRLPDRISHHYLANVQHVPWPNIQFSAKSVWVTRKTRLNLIPHIGEFDFAAMFLEHLSYEQEVFDFLEDRMSGYDAIVEVGSNVGVFTAFFSRVMKREKRQSPIFAFEPSREAFHRLLQNLDANAADNVHPFNCALSDATGFVDFFEPEGHLTNGSLSHDFAGLFSQQIKANPVIALSGAELKGLLAPHDRVLFKIDVEGAEAEVLASLREIISIKQPDIVLEVLPVSEESLSRLDFVLNQYKLFNITKNGLVEKGHFDADTRFRDYFLSPTSWRSSAPTSDRYQG